MKKFLIILLVLLILLTLVACDTTDFREFFNGIFGGYAPAPTHGPIK